MMARQDMIRCNTEQQEEAKGDSVGLLDHHPGTSDLYSITPLDKMLPDCQPRHLAMLAWALGNQKITAPSVSEPVDRRDPPHDHMMRVGSAAVPAALDKVAKEAMGKCGPEDLANIAWALAQQVREWLSQEDNHPRSLLI